MNELLLDRLNRKLAEAFGDPSRKGISVHARLDPDTRYDESSGGLVGGLTFFVTTRAGDDKPAHHEPMGLLTSSDELDDWLAGALSKFLEKHPKWPV